jgi:hypothetical protein
MCCRIYRAHPLTRVIEGLIVLLTTFVIGFATVQLFLISDPPAFISQKELVDGCHTEDQVTVHASYFKGVEDPAYNLDGLIISNFGTDSIYYCENVLGGLGETIIYPDGYGREDFVDGVVCTMKELKPGGHYSKTYQLWTINPDAHYSMEFRYYLGASRSPRTLKTHFANGRFKQCVEGNVEQP